MTDGIYNNVRRPAPDTPRGAAGKAENKAAAGLFGDATQAASDAAAASKPKSGGADQLHLSNVSKRLDEQPGFDRVKVDSIKKAIEDGNYPLDARRIAESFHAIEQMING
jgi:negative regulator of flagellin synthesis FlgM